MVVSIVVCTRDRTEKLSQCLAALRQIDTSVAWEVVVVDNGTTRASAELMRSAEACGDLELRVVVEPVGGLGRARNLGWREARGDVVAFVDDDCRVTPSFVDDVAVAFADERIGFVAGRILRANRRDLKVTIEERTRARAFDPQRFIAAGSVHGANLAIRREVLVAIGGFDPNLGAGTPFCAEDIEAVARASWRGVSGVYDARPTVVHDHGRRTRAERRAVLRSYDRGRGAYFASLMRHRPARLAYGFGWLRTTAAGSAVTIRPGRPFRELAAAIQFLRVAGAKATGEAEPAAGELP